MRASLLGQHPLHIDSKKPWREALHRQRDQFGAPRIENTSQENWNSLRPRLSGRLTLPTESMRIAKAEVKREESPCGLSD